MKTLLQPFSRMSVHVILLDDDEHHINVFALRMLVFISIGTIVSFAISVVMQYPCQLIPIPNESCHTARPQWTLHKCLWLEDAGVNLNSLCRLFRNQRGDAVSVEATAITLWSLAHGIAGLMLDGSLYRNAQTTAGREAVIERLLTLLLPSY